MGNYCHDVQNQQKYHDKEQKDQPSSSYAIEIIDPKEIPCDLAHIRTLLDSQNVIEPDWYQPYQCVKIDAFFLIKRYDLYYRGEWRKGVPYGLGQVVTRDGEYFKGFFKDGIAKGPKCIFILSPQTYYIGSVDQNQRNGRGKFVDKDYEYQGQWFSNLPHGTGREVFPNGDKFYGEFVLGKKQGEGQYIWKNGQFQIYRGNFRNNQMNRQGQLTCRDGRVWKGTFSCEQKFIIQQAQCVTQDRTFEGTLVNGKPDTAFTIIQNKTPKDEKCILTLQNNKYNGKVLSDRSFMVFQNKVLVYYDQTIIPKDMANILQTIQSSYAQSSKHSQALNRIFFKYFQELINLCKSTNVPFGSKEKTSKVQLLFPSVENMLELTGKSIDNRNRFFELLSDILIEDLQINGGAIGYMVTIIGYGLDQLYCNIIGFNMQTSVIGSGLQNLGNTCFFNATLQSLLYAPPLAILFTQRTHSDNCIKRNTTEWCVFCQMQKIFNSTRQGRCFSPNNMLKNLSKIFKKFKLGRQEDSHEFLRYLIEGMQQSETGKLGKEREENDKRIRKTKIFDIFGGIIKTCVECLNCSHKSITTERYYDFNIVQECQRASSLHQGISSFFAVDKLEGSNKYLCQHCKVRSNARKRFLLESVPQVATFQLKRFTNSMRKISKFMQYPLEIDLGKFLQKPRKLVMKLFAVIVHLGGSSFSGHYYAFVRHGNFWYKMDDSYVSKCNLQTVTGQQAYILFYQRERIDEPQKNGINGVKIVEEKLNSLKKDAKKDGGKQAQKHLQNGIYIQTIKKKQQKTSHVQRPIHEQPLKNGNLKENQKGDKSFESTKESEQVENPLFTNIQNLLVSKLAGSQVFKNMELQNHMINDTISKVVKQVIMEVSPKKKPEQDNDHKLSQSMDLELPGLARRKSKEQLEKQLPMAELILRTFQRIIELQAKIPPKRPHNYAQRSIYNLRKYETKMQKRRKIG